MAPGPRGRPGCPEGRTHAHRPLRPLPRGASRGQRAPRGHGAPAGAGGPRLPGLLPDPGPPPPAGPPGLPGLLRPRAPGVGPDAAPTRGRPGRLVPVLLDPVGGPGGGGDPAVRDRALPAPRGLRPLLRTPGLRPPRRRPPGGLLLLRRGPHRDPLRPELPGVPAPERRADRPVRRLRRHLRVPPRPLGPRAVSVERADRAALRLRRHLLLPHRGGRHVGGAQPAPGAMARRGREPEDLRARPRAPAPGPGGRAAPPPAAAPAPLPDRARGAQEGGPLLPGSPGRGPLLRGARARGGRGRGGDPPGLRGGGDPPRLPGDRPPPAGRCRRGELRPGPRGRHRGPHPGLARGQGQAPPQAQRREARTTGRGGGGGDPGPGRPGDRRGRGGRRPLPLRRVLGRP